MFIFEYDGVVKSCAVNPTTTEAYKNATVYEVQSQDGVFQEAWIINKGKLDINLDKAKDIVHSNRRIKRNKAYEPHDKTIQIHGLFNKELADEAEAKRQVIREADDKLQVKINKCRSIETLKKLMVREGL